MDTACSSWLLAVHMACRSLQEGESDLALAGGVNVMLEPRRFVSASAQDMVSPGGSTDIITIPGFADHPWPSGEPQPAEGLGDKWSE